MTYKKISTDRKVAARLGEMAVYFSEGRHAPRVGLGRRVDIPYCVAVYNRMYATLRRLEGTGSAHYRNASRAASHMMWEMKAYLLEQVRGSSVKGEYELVLPVELEASEARSDLLRATPPTSRFSATSPVGLRCAAWQCSPWSIGAMRQRRGPVSSPPAIARPIGRMTPSDPSWTPQELTRKTASAWPPRDMLDWVEIQRQTVEAHGVFKQHAEEVRQPGA